MDGQVDDPTGFEVAIVVPRKREEGDKDGSRDCVEFLALELERAGLIVERVCGISDEFLKLAAPIEVLGRAAAELQMKKLTYIGIELQFEWDEVSAFVRQPDGSLFSWCERYHCFHKLIYNIINKTGSDFILYYGGKGLKYETDESLVKVLEKEGIVKQVFPIHDETKRKQLLRTWALYWLDFTWQPIDEIYLYYGTKIATYFSFLGCYTQWLFFPAVFGLAVQLFDFGSLQLLVLPAFFILVVTWAVFFFQFWKRKNFALLARWGINYSLSDYKAIDTESSQGYKRKVNLEKLSEEETLLTDEVV